MVQEGRAWKDSPRVGSAGPGVPAASADSLQAGLEGQGWLSHFQENTELSTSAPVESFQAAQMWKNLYEMLELESSRTCRCELTLE